MNTLVFQVVIKQWDKSQRSLEHKAARAALAQQFPIDSTAQFLVFATPCIIDQHTFTSPLLQEQASLEAAPNTQRPLKKAMLASGAIQLERLIIAKQNDGDLTVSYQNDSADTILIGQLQSGQHSGWIKVKYQWRYRLENATEVFWQYEDVIVNIALADNIDKDYFLNTEAAVIKEFE